MISYKVLEKEYFSTLYLNFCIMKQITKIVWGISGFTYWLLSNQTQAFSTEPARILTDNLETRSLDQSVQYYTNNFMSFLYLIAVLYALWGWFLILTAGWDEDKVSKWKTILIQWGIGLLVIWLAGSIVKFVISIMMS